MNINAILKSISIDHFDTTLSATLITNQNLAFNKNLLVANKRTSQPYWLEYPLKGGTFEVRDQLMIGKAENNPSFEAVIKLTIEGEDFVIKRPVQYRVIDPVKGDTYQPIAVLPKLELSYNNDNFI